jgi:hypothetical protein
LKKSSSATRPPNATVIISCNYSVVYSVNSSGKYYANPKLPFARGIIVSFIKGAENSEYQPATA